MRFTTKTEYGLVCLVYLVRHPQVNSVTIKEIVRDERYSSAYMEKILQKLRSAKIVVSHQGKGGGYSLARPASQITLREVIEALEGSTFDVFCEPEIRKDIVCTHFCLCGVRPVWRRTKEVLDHLYGSITLEMIAKEEMESQSLISASR